MSKSEKMFAEANQIIEQNKNTVPITNEKFLDFLTTKINQVKDGFEDGYKVAVLIKILEDNIKQAKETLKEFVLDELKGGSLEYQNVRIEATAGGRYDYSANTEIVELQAKIKAIQSDMKRAYSASLKGQTIVNADGEIVEPAIYNHNKDSYKIIKRK